MREESQTLLQELRRSLEQAAIERADTERRMTEERLMLAASLRVSIDGLAQENAELRKQIQSQAQRQVQQSSPLTTAAQQQQQQQSQNQ